MADPEVPFVPAEELAQQARERIEASIARLGGDRDAFWRAVALIYRRGLPDSGLAPAGGQAVESLEVPAGAYSIPTSITATPTVTEATPSKISAEMSQTGSSMKAGRAALNQRRAYSYTACQGGRSWRKGHQAMPYRTT